MKREYCDVCGRNITAGAFDTASVEADRLVIKSGPLWWGGEVNREYTLCPECERRAWYMMRNGIKTVTEIKSMGLKNRIRFLLKKDLKNAER